MYHYRGYSLRKVQFLADWGPFKAGTPIFQVFKPDGHQHGVYASIRMATVCVALALGEPIPAP